jgi:hypothetical protein
MIRYIEEADNRRWWLIGDNVVLHEPSYPSQTLVIDFHKHPTLSSKYPLANAQQIHALIGLIWQVNSIEKVGLESG